MKRMLIPVLAVFLLRSSLLDACGGSDIVSVGALLQSVTQEAGYLTTEDEGIDLQALRFLAPFEATDTHRGKWLSAMAYGSAEGDNSGTGAAEELIKKMNAAPTQNAARAVVEELLNMPSPRAGEFNDSLRQAVEIIDLQADLSRLDAKKAQAYFAKKAVDPAWPTALQNAFAIWNTARKDLPGLLEKYKTSPRIPSLRLAVLEDEMHKRIIDGFEVSEVVKATPAATFDELLAKHDRWLQDYPQHPLVDLARLQRMRILYLRGATPEVWNILIGMYPKHAPRVLWEMRHLLIQGKNPTHLDPLQVDPLLMTALLRPSWMLTADQWNGLWKKSVQAAGQPWATMMQERLLVQAVQTALKDKTLPKAFPDEAAKPSLLWAHLRTLALLAADKTDEALKQSVMFVDEKNSQSAQIAARVFIAAGQPLRALDVPNINPEGANYLVQVGLDNEQLKQSAKPGKRWAKTAALTLAIRQAENGNFHDGADVLRDVDPDRAALWQKAAILPRDSLELARFLRQADGKLFFPTNSALSRGLKYRLNDLTTAPKLLKNEETQLVTLLFDGSEKVQALRAYARYLQSADPKAKLTKTALREADTTYNQLMNWDYAMEGRYQELLKNDPSVKAIREAGSRIHKAG